MARVPLQLSGAPDQAAAGAGPEAGDLHPLLREHVEMPPRAQLHPSADLSSWKHAAAVHLSSRRKEKAFLLFGEKKESFSF